MSERVAMRERGKGVEPFPADVSEFNYSAASEMPCRKHPNSPSVGVCAYCLKERLVKLVCSDCGEQRLSSCSCSDVSRTSCSTMEVGSVGRVSFLIENEKIDPNPKLKKEDKSEQVIFLRRSNSSCVEVKKSHGFWKIKRLFKKKRSKKTGEFSDDKSEIWVSDIMGVSRSRSLCSFRNGGFDEGSDCAFSSAKISDVTSGIFMDSDKQFGYFNESEARRSGFRGVELDRTQSVPNRSVFPAKESDFSAMDESAFIDLKLDLSAEPKEVSRISGASDHDLQNCRIAVNERGVKRASRSHKVWKWIFKYNPANKKEENGVLKS